MIDFEKKICSKIHGMCHGAECAQFASCMLDEVDALDCLELHNESIALEVAVIKLLRGVSNDPL